MISRVEEDAAVSGMTSFGTTPYFSLISRAARAQASASSGDFPSKRFLNSFFSSSLSLPLFR